MQQQLPKLDVASTLEALAECPACRKAYERGDAETIVEIENEHVIHTTCGGCGLAIVVSVALDAEGFRTTAALSELKTWETIDALAGDAVSIDDVIAAHGLLQDPRDAIIDTVLDQLLRYAA